MNVYLFNHNSPAAMYGIGTYIEQLTACLLRLQINVSIILLSSKEEEFCMEIKNEVTYYHIPDTLYEMNKEGASDIYNRNALYLLARYIKVSNPIFILNYYYKSSFVEVLKERWPHCKSIFVVHFMDEQMLKDIETKSDLTLYMEKVDRIVCLSNYTASLIKNDFGIPSPKYQVIYNGLKDEKTEITEEQRKSIRAKLGFGEEEKLLLFVGRVDLFKGIDFLLKAFHSLRTSSTEYRLIIVGAGCIENYLKACMDNWGKITFTGKVDRESLKEFYQITDVGIITSLHEQCSYVGIEMLMYGLPVITSAAPGLDEMFDTDINAAYKIPGLNGKENDEFHIGNILNAIKSAFSDKDKMNQIGSNGRQHYLKAYSLKLFEQQYANLFQDINNPKKG